MKHASVPLPAVLIAVVLFGLPVQEASAEGCLGGGVKGLSAVAHRLGVRPTEPSMSALNACDGRAYEIGTLLAAAIDRMERAEARIKKLEGKKP